MTVSRGVTSENSDYDVTLSSAPSEEQIIESGRVLQSLIVSGKNSPCKYQFLGTRENANTSRVQTCILFLEALLMSINNMFSSINKNIEGEAMINVNFQANIYRWYRGHP